MHRAAKDGLEECFQCVWSNTRFSFHDEVLLEIEGWFLGVVGVPITRKCILKEQAV